MRRKIKEYLSKWGKQGYADGIPDEVPAPLMRLNLAPSWKAIALAILNNDHAFKTLGFQPEDSPWYRELKRIELSARNPQMRLPL